MNEGIYLSTYIPQCHLLFYHNCNIVSSIGFQRDKARTTVLSRACWSRKGNTTSTTLFLLPLHSTLNATVQCKLLVLHAQCCRVAVCGCGWAIDLARLAWNLGHRWWSSLPSPSWKQQNDTWEKPIEIVSSLLHIFHGHGNGLCGLWTQCVPGECGQFQVGLLQTSLRNYWSCACVCLCVSEATPSQRVHLTFMRIQNWILANLWNFLVPTPRTEIWPTRLARLKCGANYV